MCNAGGVGIYVLRDDVFSFYPFEGFVFFSFLYWIMYEKIRKVGGFHKKVRRATCTRERLRI